jgi:hypothetical protein
MTKSSSEILLLNQLSLSLLTPPFLVGLMTLNSLSQGLQELGEMSEEIFRGDRLPLIPLSEMEVSQ